MSEEKKNMFQSISVGNVITLCIIVIGVVSTWTKIGLHISDDDIHLNPNKVVLTEAERDNIIKTTTAIKNKMLTIDDNQRLLIEIDKSFYGFEIKFNYLEQEHNDLEDKVSRTYRELNDEIKNFHE